MTNLTKLTDTQSIILAAAYARDDLTLYPLPGAITGDADKLIAPLIRRKLAARVGEVVTTTEAGIMAIGGERSSSVDSSSDPVVTAFDSDVGWTPRDGSKSAQVVAMLGSSEGATLDDIVSATGWLPHTARAALTGLRKRGIAIAREQRGSSSIYHIAAAA